MMTQNLLNKLKEKLPRGSVEEIANNTGVSKSYVYKVLDGSRNNIKVMNEAIKIAKQNTTKNNDVKKALAQL